MRSVSFAKEGKAWIRSRRSRVLAEMEVGTPRAIPTKVVDVDERAGTRIGILEIGAKVSVPAAVEAGDVVMMDAVTGRIV